MSYIYNTVMNVGYTVLIIIVTVIGYSGGSVGTMHDNGIRVAVVVLGGLAVRVAWG